MRLFPPLPLLAILCLGQPHLRGEEVAKPDAHVTMKVEGWTVLVDTRLRQPPHAELGGTAEALLRAKLAEVVTVMPSAELERLRQVKIWLDMGHGSLTSMQYHPIEDWLVSHGFSKALAKGVHIPVAARFVAARHQQVQPWCLLHELAHAYHDQVLGFDEPRLVRAWEKYVESKHGDKVLHVNGRKARHYALTNAKEFFAEMTEAYFGTNDFFPFVNGELREAEPEIHALLREIWGAAPVESY